MSQAAIESLMTIQRAMRADGYYGGAIDGDFGTASNGAFSGMRKHAEQWRRTLSLPDPGMALPLTEADFTAAAGKLSHAAGRNVTVGKVKAVKKVESGGAWFEDVRADILALDGEGGFLDGPDLPKILYEAHKFSAKTAHRYDVSHPNLSSRSWNRALYVGGQGEYVRLHRAMQLNRQAALESASVGLFQVLGEHWRHLGYASVEEFWELQKESEGAQLDAFVRFCIANGIADDLARCTTDPATCVPFVSRYNGPGYAQNRYDVKLAAAIREFGG